MAKPTKALTLQDCLAVRQTCLALNLRGADRLVTQTYDAAMKRHGLKSTQFSVMVTLHAIQPATISGLAEQLGVDRTTLTRNLTVLKRLGWIAPQRSADLRESPVALTAEGERRIAAAFPDWEKSQAQMKRVLGDGLMAELLGQTRKFIQAMQ